MVVHAAIKWGWKDPSLTVKQRERITKAACRQVAYDLGHAASLATTSVVAWIATIIDTKNLYLVLVFSIETSY